MIKLLLPLVLLFTSLTCFGVTSTAEQIKEWRQLAEQGHANGQNHLGIMYSFGRGVPEDLVVAYMWWNLAAAQGHETAKKNKNSRSKVMTKEQIAEGQKLSREWLAKRQE